MLRWSTHHLERLRMGHVISRIVRATRPGAVIATILAFALGPAGPASAQPTPTVSATPTPVTPDCVVSVGDLSTERCYVSVADVLKVIPLTNYVEAVDYSGTSYSGSSLTWTYNESGCPVVNGNHMPAGWGDTVQSIIAYNGCATTIFATTTYGTPSYAIGVNGSASTLGAMNDNGNSQLFCDYDGCED